MLDLAVLKMRGAEVTSGVHVGYHMVKVAYHVNLYCIPQSDTAAGSCVAWRSGGGVYE